MIDIKKVEEKIKLLEDGKILFMYSSCYGKYKVSMNKQLNRIVAVPYDDIAKKNEEKMAIVNKDGIVKTSSESIVENIEKYILWGYGFWSVEIEPKRVEIREVFVEGVYKNI